MSSLKVATIVGTGAAIGAFIAIAVVMPQAASAAASASKLILTQWLGLGTTTPSQRLSVAGSAYITGNVITDSGIKFSDGTTQTTAASGVTIPSGTLCGICIDGGYNISCQGNNVCSGYCPSGYTWTPNYSAGRFFCVKN